MSHARCKTEHAGAKNRRGFHGTRADAKAASRVKRRAADKRVGQTPEDFAAQSR